MLLQIEVRITSDSQEDAERIAKALIILGGGPLSAVTISGDISAPPETKRKSEAATPRTRPEPEPEPEDNEPDSDNENEDAPVPEDEIDKDVIKEILTRVSTVCGRDTLKEILDEFGAASISKVRKSDYVNVYSAARKALGLPSDAKETEKPSRSEHQKEVELADVRDELAKLSRGGKREVVVKLLAKYGAKSLSDVEQSDLPKLLRDIEKAKEE